MRIFKIKEKLFFYGRAKCQANGIEGFIFKKLQKVWSFFVIYLARFRRNAILFSYGYICPLFRKRLKFSNYCTRLVDIFPSSPEKQAIVVGIIEQQSLYNLYPFSISIQKELGQCGSCIAEDVVYNTLSDGDYEGGYYIKKSDKALTSDVDLEINFFFMEQFFLNELSLDADLLTISKQRKSHLRRPAPFGGRLAFLPKRTCKKPVLMLFFGTLHNGGAERLTGEIVRDLTQNGWDILVVITEDNQDLSIRRYDSVFFGDIPVIYLSSFLYSICDRIDFIHYLIISRNASVIWQAGSNLLYQIITDLRHKYPECSCVDILFNASGFIKVHNKLKKYFDLTITENKQVYDLLQVSNASSARSTVSLIESGVDVGENSNNPPCMLRAKLGINPSSMVVGFSGRLSYEKGPDIFIEVAQLCQSCKKLSFVITGTGPMEKEIKKLLADYRLLNLHYVGYVDDIKSYLNFYDIMAVPSRIDGRPLVVMESMMLATPCIATYVGGLPEMINHGETGLILESASPELFANMLIELANYPEKVVQMGEAAKKYAEKYFNKQRMLNVYRETFNNLLFKQNKTTGRS